MTELRQRIAAALTTGWERHIAERGVAADFMTDEALSVFAEWLRERATERYFAKDDYESYLAPGGALDLVEKLIADMAPKP